MARRGLLRSTSPPDRADSSRFVPVRLLYAWLYKVVLVSFFDR